ncbi:MAG: histidine phosphatase family protein, partial [Firmicutes bacterium]|nr:histidine phosphatase family protein [Bacillota bacterium]
MPRDIILVRHAQSQANAEGRLANKTWDPPLTPVGRQQAHTLIKQFDHIEIAGIASSPMLRAQQTIDPLAQSRGLSIDIVPLLAEVDLGRWDGQLLDDIAVKEPDLFHAWRKDPDSSPPPGGEGLLTVGRRVLHALAEYAATQKDGLIVAATHADCIKGAALVVMDVPGAAASHVMVANIGQILLR